MPQLCLAVASLALSTSRPVSVVLLANRLSLVLPYLLWYHTLLSSAVVSRLPEYCPFRPECFPYDFKILSKYQIGPILSQVRPTADPSHTRRVHARAAPA